MYDADNMPVLNLREWLAARHIILVSIRDADEVWVREDLDDDVVDRLQCEFENAELEHVRQHVNRRLAEAIHDKTMTPPDSTVDWEAEYRKWHPEVEDYGSGRLSSSLYYCTVEEGIPDCPGHNLEYEYCPGARQPLRCPENDPGCDEQACPEHPRHQDGEHTYEQHHSPADHQGGRCFCHG